MNLFEESKKLDDRGVAVGKLVGCAIKAEDEIPPVIKSRLSTVGTGLGGNRRKSRAHCELGCKTRKMNWRGGELDRNLGQSRAAHFICGKRRLRHRRVR